MLFFFKMSLSKARKIKSNLSFVNLSVRNARFQVKTRLDQFHIQIGNSSFFNCSLEEIGLQWLRFMVSSLNSGLPLTEKSIFLPRPTVQTQIIQKEATCREGYRVKPNLCMDQITKPNMSCATWLKGSNLQTELHHRHAVRWLMAWCPTMPEKPKSCSRITRQLLCG